MIKEKQGDIYKRLMLPTLKTIIHMELVGLPMILDSIKSTKHTLDNFLWIHTQVVECSPIIIKFEDEQRLLIQAERNAKLKVKVKPLSDFIDYSFNPNSGKQLRELLYDYLQLPISDLTDTKLPATGAKTLKKLLIQVTKPDEIKLLESLVEINKVSKILSTFIPAFENGIEKADNRIYLHGNFNLGVVKSMRLSSSGPNLQQIPSTGTVYAKPIKKCFSAADGWILAGADFSSLEAMVDALLTKDPEKQKIYLEGYDSHSYRALHYWPDKFPDIDPTSVEAVNSIQKLYPKIRQDSKQITFASQYGGTFHTFMDAGFSEKEAKEIEANYHKLYSVSDEWVKSHMISASKKGYVPLAFGGRLRTPILAQVVYGNAMPYKAHEEARTAANALTQSYGQLTNRAANAFMERVYKSKYKYDIKICAMIHDAIYLIIKSNLGCVKWVNDNLIDCMKWQDTPELKHDVIKLGASLELYPSWANPVTLSNSITKREILNTVKRK